MKIKDFYNKKSSTVVFVLLAIIIFTGLFLFSKKQSTLIGQSKRKIVVTEDAEIKEEIKDGVYTNYTYGFKFEYPSEIFNKINSWSKNSGKEFFVEGQRFPQLSVRYWKKDFYEDYYNECLEVQDNDLFNKSNEYNVASKRRYVLNNRCVSLSVPFNEIYPDEPSNYVMVTPRADENGYIAIYLSGATFSDTQALEKMFDDIVISFEFID